MEYPLKRGLQCRVSIALKDVFGHYFPLATAFHGNLLNEAKQLAAYAALSSPVFHNIQSSIDSYWREHVADPYADIVVHTLLWTAVLQFVSAAFYNAAPAVWNCHDVCKVLLPVE